MGAGDGVALGAMIATGVPVGDDVGEKAGRVAVGEGEGASVGPGTATLTEREINGMSFAL
jgi:hypothetical protein